MAYFAPQEVPVRCPNCGFEFTVPVYSILDAQDMPDEVHALITGSLNTFRCPRCGTTGMLNVPLFYHDSQHQLAFVYIPTAANLSQEQRQRIIGEMTRAIMTALPQDQPKGYLLQPREFISLENMLDAIMEARGIDKNLLEERRQKAELIDRLLSVMDDSVAFSAIVGKHRQQMDEEFYGLIRYARDVAAQLGQTAEAERLEALRQKLLPLTAWGKKEQAYDKAIALLQLEPSRETLLDQLIEASEEEVEALVRVLRPLIDYRFFQMLTQRIEQTRKEDQEQAQSLEALRDRILVITSEIDKETQREVEKASNLLKEIVASENIDQAVERNLSRIDDVFLFVLSSQLKQAETAKLPEITERLQQVWEAIEKRTQPQLPPEIAFIDELLVLPYPDGTRAYLEAHRDQLSPEIVKLMELLAQDLQRQGENDIAQRLRAIRAQALALMQ